ncbi:MAG: PDZ domain-containing protein [Phycisphaerales bacterium]
MRLASGPQRRVRCAVVLVGTSAGILISCASLAGGRVDTRQTDLPVVRYTVRLDQPQTQMIDVSIELRDVHEETVDLSLPIWRPGRYIVLDHASTVREVQAFDGTGRTLDLTKIDKSTWRIQTGGTDVLRVDYRIYANSLGDRTRHVDDTHAFLSGTSVFLYNADRRQNPAEVHIEAPEGWRIASGLDFKADDSTTLVARNYDVLVDSPIEIGLHDVIRFQAGGKPHELVIWGKANYNEDQLIQDITKIVEAQREIFGELPYQRYVFLLHVGKGARGGTEHLNSTIMQTSRRSLEDEKSYSRFLGLVSHEFFHTWNVKRLRPAGIHPYDYQSENYTKLLWVCEGTTSYYDDLTLVRTGLIKPKKYLQIISDAINRYRDRPGRLVQSLEDSSFDAWIKFGPSPDDVNSEVSFYAKGALVSLLLDLEIRRVTQGVATFDAVMRRMYERFPLSGPGYTPQDLINTVNEIAEADLTAFFARYVRGTEALDLESALETVGLELYFKAAKQDEENGGDEENGQDQNNDGAAEDEPQDGESDEADAPPIKAYLGLVMGGNTVRSVRSDSPAYEAGVQPRDELLAIDGRRVTAGELDERLKRYEPGDEIRLTLFRRDDLRELSITLASKSDGKWTLRRVNEPTDPQVAAYELWLGQEWPKKKNDQDEKEPSEPKTPIEADR